MEIKIDDREKNTKLISAIQKQGLILRTERLKTGDYQYKDILIEAKSIDDFCSSILDNRLTSQLTRMEAKSKQTFLLVYGKIQDRYTKIHENCVVGKLVSLSISHPTKIIWADNEKQAAFAMKRIFERLTETPKI